MDDENEEEEVTFVGPRRMGLLDIPVCFLNLVTAVTGSVSNFFSDVTIVVATHANYMRDEREFRDIVRNYDNASGIGTGAPESED